MKHYLAALLALGIVGTCSIIPGASAADVSLVTLENEIQESSAFSIEFTTWGVIFGVSILLLILSFAKFETNTSVEFFGFSGFVLSGLCAIAVPFVGHTEYIAQAIALDNSSIVQAYTPIVVADGNMFMLAVALFFVVIQLLNALRILSKRIGLASGAVASTERRTQRRNELFGSRRY